MHICRVHMTTRNAKVNTLEIIIYISHCNYTKMATHLRIIDILPYKFKNYGKK